MNLLDKLLGKKEEEKPEEDPEYFTRNRNKPMPAKVLMPTRDEIKQQEAERGL